MKLQNVLPITSWGHSYSRSFLRADVVAGVTVTALVVPKNLGYAEIAGVPIENGLYAAAAGAVLYAIFGTSRQISTGPSSGLAAVAGSTLLASGIAGGQDATPFVALIALFSGILFLLMSVLRMGWISQFISKAVITGFLFGAAIDVVIGELPKITGTDASGSNSWREFWSWLQGIDELHSTTLVVGGCALAFLFGLHAVAPRLPGELIVVVIGLVLSSSLNLEARGVALVGEVPSGLPSLQVPPLQLATDHFELILGAAIATVLIGFSQSAGDARYFAAKNDYRVDINQESLAQGAANIGAGLFQGIPVSTSLSASSLNDRAGAKSQIASLVTGAAIILTLIFLAPVFSDLPKAILAAVIIEAVTLGMMDVPELRKLYAVRRSDFLIAITALAGVIFFGVLAGVVVGVALSLIWLLRVVTSPSIVRLGRAKGTHVYRDLESNPDDEDVPGVLAIRLEGALFFVTADSLESRIGQLVEESETPVHLLVLDCQSINFIDTQGADTIARIAGVLRDRNTDFKLARVKKNVFDTLEKDGVIAEIGVEHLHLDVNDAVESFLTRQAPVSP